MYFPSMERYVIYELWKILKTNLEDTLLLSSLNKNISKVGIFLILYIWLGAYKNAHGRKIDQRAIVVDIERGRISQNFIPRRFGGILGGSIRKDEKTCAALLKIKE